LDRFHLRFARSLFVMMRQRVRNTTDSFLHGKANMVVAQDYREFIAGKAKFADRQGFKPTFLPDWMFDFQKHLTDWAICLGRSMISADCGMGKTPMQLVFAENCIRHTNKPAIIVTPLSVGLQTVSEAEKFGIKADRTRDGVMPKNPNIVVTNYEQLHKYDPKKFCAVVCDESSGIKDFKSDRKATVVEFARTIPYRLLCTATAAPNDYWELGTSSEALGYLGFRDMITTFFKQETSKNHHGWGRTKYRFRGHAEEPFWSWVCSWARSLRKPSDLGFSDDGFELPSLNEVEYVVQSSKCRPGMLFPTSAKDMREEREERRLTIEDRCNKATELANAVGDRPCVVWCELNPEADMMERMLDGSVQVSGSMKDEAKEEAFHAFSTGQIKRLITKPKIGAWGLNWQHCSDTIVFPSHSFEQYYQLVRRFYRFGQKNEVNVSLVLCEGEEGILRSLKRKQHQTSRMFDMIVQHMRDSMSLVTRDYFPESERIPSWL
jgi:hypothetical protein